MNDSRKQLYEDFDWLPALECSEGWDGLIRGMAVELERAIGRDALQHGADFARGGGIWNDSPEPEGAVHAFQVKEKFGTLRCYLIPAPEAASEIVDRYERLSGSVCEACGRPGRMRDEGWSSTLCDDHAQERWG